MKVISKTALLVAVLASTISLARSEPDLTANLSKTEVKQMVRGAHTAQQYRALAGYFSARQKKFEEQASSEKQEWERRSQNVTGPAAKYPRPVDSSKNRYDYFSYEANQMGEQAAKYENLAAQPQ